MSSSSKFQYFEISLQQIIQHFIKCQLKKKDWKVVAVDTAKGVVVLRRLEGIEKPKIEKVKK